MYQLQASHITMNFILVCLFGFTVGSLAAKIPNDADNSEVLDVNGGKQSSDLLSAQRDTSVITKRGASGKHNSDRWVKLNYYPVCFGARGNQFGRFNAPYGGRMAAVKLVHLYGYVSCDIRRSSYWSYWGCGNNPYAGIKDLVDVVITTADNRNTLLPPSQFTTSFLKWSKIPGYNSLSSELVLSSFSQPFRVTSGQRLHLWYAEDLLNQSEGDNGGRACCDVYGLYV